MTGSELARQEPAGFLSPAVTVKDALAAYQAKKDLIDGIMKQGTDYGAIPGTGTKPTLLKAGAEKACSFFGLSARFADAEVVEDFTGAQHGGEPFFFYRRTCNLYRGDYLIASVDGSCNSWEKKYRYRSTERLCPECNKPAIIKGRAEFGGGWLCYHKKGGCGAKFLDDDPQIVGQYVGQVPNPDVADLTNTILKMADKRALVAATLIATGLSDYFTQDIEDFVHGEVVEVAPENESQEDGKTTKPVELIDTMGDWAVGEAAKRWNVAKKDAAMSINKAKLGKMSKADFKAWLDDPGATDKGAG